MRHDLSTHSLGPAGRLASAGRASRATWGLSLLALAVAACGGPGPGKPAAPGPQAGPPAKAAPVPVPPVPPVPYWKPPIEPILARTRPIAATRAELRAQRDGLARGLATFDAARETAAVEAARTRNQVIALLLQDDCPLADPPDFSTLKTLPLLNDRLRLGRSVDGKFVVDRGHRLAPPMLKFNDYQPVELHIDALDRLDHLSRHKGDVEPALRRLDEYLGTIADDGDGPFELPPDVAWAYVLEFSLRGERSDGRIGGFVAAFWNHVRAELKRLEPLLNAAWRALPELPRESTSAEIDWKASAWEAWPDTQVVVPWRLAVPERRNPRSEHGLQQSARFQSGDRLRAMLLSFEEADQILRVLTTGPGPAKIPAEPYRRYRDELGERIVEPFARGAAERAVAGDLDGLLDCLEVLHALPIRVPAMERLRQSVGSRFPVPGAGASVDDRVRARRFRALAGVATPPRLPAPPVSPPPAENHSELGSPWATIEAGVEVVGLALAPDGGRLAAIRAGQADRVYALPLATVVGEFESFAGNQAGSFLDRTSVAFSPDGSRLAAAPASDTVRLFRTAGWSLLRDLRPVARKGVDTLAFAPGSGRLLVGQAGRIRLYNADGQWLGGALFPYDDLFGRVGRFSDDGRLALVEGLGQRVLNLPAGRSEPLLGTLGRVLALDGTFSRTVIAPQPGALTLVDLRGPALARTVDGYNLLAALSADGQVLVHAASYTERKYEHPKDRLVFRHAPDWEVVAQVAIPSLRGQREVRPLPGGRAIVLVAEGGVALVDTGSFQARTLYLPHGIERHAFSADGRTLAIVERREKTTVKIWRFPGETP